MNNKFLNKLSKLKKLIFSKETLMTLVWAGVITCIFLLYVWFVGIPLTKSENKYNEGLRYYNNEYYEKALNSFQEADEIWPNKDAKKYIELIEEK
jgi:hypothetical protein